MYLYFTMNKIKEISILVIFGLILFSINSITKRKISEKQKTIISLPINTVQYTQVQSVQLLKKFVYNMLFIAKDQMIFEKLKLIVENRDKNDFSVSDLNIDMTAPIELIKLNFDNENHLIIRMVSTEEGISGKSSLPYFETNNKKYFLVDGNKKNITALKKQFLNSFKYTLTARKDISILNFDDRKVVLSSNISVQKNRIKVIVNENNQNKQLLLKASGLHFSFPVDRGIQVGEQLQKIPILPRITFPFKEIRHVSGNYYGFKFTENDSIAGIPKIDLLLKFNQKTSADSLISNLMKELQVGFTIHKNELTLGNERIFFSQITPKTIYLSTLNQRGNFVKTNQSFKIAGNLNLLTKLENAGWKGMLIEIIPVFKSTKNLFQTTKSVEFKKNNSNSYEILIPMKANKNVYHELLKLALSSTF